MLLMKDIIDDKHENIRKRATAVEFPLSEDDGATMDALMEYIHNSVDDDIAEKYGLRPSVGIAAPQINIQKQMAAVSFENENGEFFEYELINPQILRHSVFLTYLPNGEGCLSVPYATEGIVTRPERITVRNHKRDGTPYELQFEGYAAIVVQHEIDHLKGILFIDKINPDNPFAIPENAKPIEFPADAELDIE